MLCIFGSMFEIMFGTLLGYCDEKCGVKCMTGWLCGWFTTGSGRLWMMMQSAFCNICIIASLGSGTGMDSMTAGTDGSTMTARVSGIGRAGGIAGGGISGVGDEREALGGRSLEQIWQPFGPGPA